MADNNNLDVILKEKMDNYGFKRDNFVAPSELTVTITLNEYRELVGKAAILEETIGKLKTAKYEADRLAESLKEENATLKAELYEKSKKEVEEERRVSNGD